MAGLGLACTFTLASCARPHGAEHAWQPEREQASHPLAGYEAHFWLTWNGARIGDAAESLRRRDGGMRFERRERMSVWRGDTLVHSETTIAALTDAELSAREITVWQISDQSVLRGRARRGDGGEWVARYGDEETRRLPGEAVPAELVPLLIAARWHTRGRAPKPGQKVFDGLVILAGYGFATARLTVVSGNGREQTATLHTPHGIMRGRFMLTQNGTVARVHARDGVGAVRVDRRDRALPFQPPELVDSTSLPIVPTNDRSHDQSVELPRGPGWAGQDLEPTAGITTSVADEVGLFIAPVTRQPPPPLPGQKVEVGQDSWYVRLYPGDVTPVVELSVKGDRTKRTVWTPGRPDRGGHGVSNQGSGPRSSDPALRRLADRIIADSSTRDQRDEIVALATADLLDDDLGSSAISARAALAVGRGDCTAHAALFVALARARGIPARLVTGYRIDGDRLVRHRWAIARADRAWIAVDPTYGEAPTGPHLVGLAVHEGSFADMALADELAFSGFVHARAYWVQ
ncbi:MAG: transglutaminase-like domain-containing protein [Proteobacteria bacterium]|nr:transglutaminase-like domain-containing protein [Pseudomonadota bacterium]